MAIMKHSPALWTISLLMAVSSIVLPADAQYSGGSGTALDPYQIATAADLIALGETPADYDKHFLLTTDIDLDPNLPGRKVFDKAVIGFGTNVSGLFGGTRFSGFFDGSGHTVSHLTITGDNYVGLFGYLTSGAEVKDLGVVDVNATGSGYVIGGLVGVNAALVTRCYSTGTVSGKSVVGGLVGYNGGTLTQCYSTGAVSGKSVVGGLVGNNGSAVTDCYSTGAVSGSMDVGGLGGANMNTGLVTQCYSSGAVSGAGQYSSVGGLLGDNEGDVANCYSSGAVRVTGQYSSVGGLAGYNNGTMNQCYSSGTVSGTGQYSSVGGLVGYTDLGSVTSSFWDTQTSGQATSSGGTGKTTAQMQTAKTFLDAGWDFVGETKSGTEDTWKISEGLGYPRLWWEKYSGGSGTAQDPYQIATAADLIALGETPADYDKHFLLTADIDLDPNLPGRNVFDKGVIAPDTDPKKVDFQGIPFIGVFDGNGHRISHLTLKGEGYLGLFGQLGYGAAVRKLGVVAVNITGSGDLVGGLAAENFGAVTQCYSTGTVSGTGQYGPVGGLVGGNGGVVIQCYSTGAVIGTGQYGLVGGLVGLTGGRVIQCYSTGLVGEGSGGLVGDGYAEAGSPPKVIACFWDTQSSGQTTSWGGGTGLTTAQMQTASTFLDAGWDFVGAIEDGKSQIWQMPEGGGYPVLAVFNGYTPPRLQGAGAPQDPYTVSDALELGAMVYYSPYAHYHLTASIDLSGIHWRTAVIPWFAGTFDSSNHTISNLAVNGECDLGLFAILGSGAAVRDLGVVDVNVVGSGARVGGLAGYIEDDAVTLTHCYTTGRVSSTDGSVGGLVGQSGEHHSAGGSVTQCYSTCAVSGTGDSVGGLVGFSMGDVTQCHSTGAVGGKDYVGGLLGYGSATNCYSTGPVSGKDCAGGLLGYGGATNCYSSGPVVGSGKRVGGLVGENDGSVTACFWDTQTSGQTTSAGGTGRTTAQMQTAKTFLDAGWDFVGETANGGEDLWWIDEGKDYPRLWWEAPGK